MDSSEERLTSYVTFKLEQRANGKFVKIGREMGTFPEDTIAPVRSCKTNGSDGPIGVHYVQPEISALDFRRDALLFQRIAVPMLGWQVRSLQFQVRCHPDDLVASAKADELSWLVEQGILFEPPVYEKLPSPRVAELHGDSDALSMSIMRGYERYWATKDTKWLDDVRKNQDCLCDLHSRFKAVEIVEYEGVPASPILSSATSLDVVPGTGTDVLQIVLENIPVPDPLTPWEHIIEFRASDNAKHALKGLHVWAAEVAKGGMTVADIRDKLAWELETYDRYMTANRMEATSSRMEIILTTAGEILEGLVRLKFGKAMQTVFSLRKRRAELIKSELAAPGRELGYISNVRTQFRKKK